MDLWVTRGMPKPPLPHVPGCDVAGVVEAVGDAVRRHRRRRRGGDQPGGVAGRRHRGASATTARWARASQIYGEHTWGGHAQWAVAPARNVFARRPGRSWEECAAYPLATLTAYRMLRRARVRRRPDRARGRRSVRACRAPPSPSARHIGAHVVATSRSADKREQATAMGAVAVVDSAAERWPVQADVVVESVGAGHVGPLAARAEGRADGWWCAAARRGPRSTINLPRLFFKQYEIIGSSMGSYQEFAEVTRLRRQTACRRTSTRCSASTSTRPPSPASSPPSSWARSSSPTDPTPPGRAKISTSIFERSRSTSRTGIERWGLSLIPVRGIVRLLHHFACGNLRVRGGAGSAIGVRGDS